MASVWTVSIDDTSSLISYLPHGDGGVGDQTSTGWQPWFSDSGGFNSAGGKDGLGMSYHVTALSGARLDFQFYGTGIALYGNASCSYDVSVDGNTQNLQAGGKGQLFAQDGLHEQMHHVSLTANASNSSRFWFDRVDVSRPLPSGISSPTSTSYPATNTSFIKYDGNWTVQNDPNAQIPSRENPAPFYEVSDAPASLSFSFEGTGVAVNGSRNWGGWTYDVNLDGTDSGYNASTMWLIGDALLFYQDGLDPTKTHTVNITPKVGGGFKFWLNSVTILSDSGVASGVTTNTYVAPSSSCKPPKLTTGDSSTSSAISNPTPTSGTSTAGSKQTNVGVIVGPVVAGVAVLLILAALGLWYLRRRRAFAAFTSANFSPYVLPPGPAPAPAIAGGEGGAATTSPSPLAAKLANESNSPYATTRAAPVSPAATPPTSVPPRSAVSAVSPQTVAPPPSLPLTPGEPQTSASAAASTVVTQPSSPDSHAAVDRLIQIIADRIDRTRPLGYGSDVPPPGYDA
ncbi:hypothetical protein C8Q77DRAFT_1225406 [Trametes polyzona]|nr:hypothetical protein C8Q77DRAFT_1225406 [Trametes polyzona]